MATVKLSGIITSIAGTIGGVTYRRHGATTVVSAKSSGSAKSVSVFNPRLSDLRTLVINWGSLSATVRANWVAAALLFTFPDKFGTYRNLSGRQLYLKLQGNQIVVSGSALDPTTLASAINTGVNPVFVVSMTGGAPFLAKLDFDATISNTIVLIQVQMLKSLAISPTFTKRQIIAFKNYNSVTTYDFSSELLAKFPNIKTGDILQFYITYQNLSGFRSTPVTIQYIVIA